MKPRILRFCTTLLMCIGILLLIFALEELVNLRFLMTLSYLASFLVLTSLAYMISEHPETIYDFLVSMHNDLYGLVLTFFTGINRRIGSKLSIRQMEEETAEHVRLLCIVFCFLLPASLLYLFTDFYLFKENALDSMLLGLLIFFYSNFLPDLPSIYRKKENGKARDLKWYKKYSLLLFAPLLIWVFYSGVRLSWRTTETYHNFKSLTVFGAFLFLLSFVAFGDLSISIGDMTEIVSLPLYGLIGYLTHLKVDKIW
ncbi:MAG: hypothetical protein JSV05_06365 [Candidatus Bathyarchaeota archaeon]|nr:MAG: hypothetical protein JSV05_06365 [Candidatus Bathyarchaeota archaeon]